MHACVTDGQTEMQSVPSLLFFLAAGQGKVEGGSMGNATS